MNKLTTKKDFINYSTEKATGTFKVGFKYNSDFQFAVLANQLVNDEYGLCSFYLKLKENNNDAAGLLTNKRLIISQAKFINGTVVSIAINNINDISINNNLAKSELVIDSLKETIIFKDNRSFVEHTYQELQNVLNEIKNNLIVNNSENISDSNDKYDKYDKLNKLKKLLDDNIITQEEFNAEKKKLLEQ